jgi:hypothetical protein
MNLGPIAFGPVAKQNIMVVAPGGDAAHFIAARK